MKTVERAEILPIGEYEMIRPHFRARIIEEKRPRRVAMSDLMTVLFENRDSVLLQIQEMLRTERITAEPAVLHEIETYNELVPGQDEVSVTLFVNVPPVPEERDRKLIELAGLEDHFTLEVDGVAFHAKGKRPEAVPERTTAVHYLKFALDPVAAGKLRGKTARAALVVDHPRHEVRFELPPATLAKLAEDLAG
jgi:hypothetical protein